MAKGDSADIFAFFWPDSGDRLAGECSTVLKTPGEVDNGLLKDFEPGKMFEISRFTFGVGGGSGDDDKLAAALKEHAKTSGIDPKKIQQWANQKNQDARKKKADANPEPDPIRVTRLMDRATVLLLNAMIDRTWFKQVAIVKRKSAGGVAAGQPYLRLDFKGVMLTEASFSNDDPIEENYTLQTRYIMIRYCPQLPDGSLGAPVTAEWDMSAKTGSGA